MDYDIISFDLDGTLVDTAAEIAEAANRTLDAHGLARRTPAEITSLIGPGSHKLMLGLLARCLIDAPHLAQSVRVDAVLTSFEEHYAATAGSTATPYHGCHEALTQLKNAGVRLACVTNKELRHARRVLAATQLDGYFDLTIGGDSLAEHKPHPSVLRHVVTTLRGSAARTAHVGDSITDIEAARNAGVGAWAVPYGYNAGVPIADAKPQRLFQNLQQVADHVLGTRQACLN